MSDATDRTEEALDTKNTVRSEGKARDTDAPDDSLLEMDKAEAARQMLKEWDDSWKQVKKYSEEWKVNKARAQGYIGVALLKRQDHNQAYIPTGAKKGVAGMNKAKRLMRRLRANIFADPPMPEASPANDTDEDRDAAETATRVLTDLTSEGNLAYTLHAGDAFDLGGIYGSGFLRFWVDETGGGWKPEESETPDSGGKYVGEDGQPTDDVKKAKRTWLPKLRDEVLTGKQVRFLPYDVRDIWEADGVMVGTALTLGELERLFPDIKEWPEDRRAALAEARPQHFKDILEPHQKDTMTGEVTSKSLVFVLTRYHTQSARYPMGAYLIAAGEDELLHKSDWYDHRHGSCLDIPITQFKQLTEEGNPYGEGVMCGLGPGNEVRGSLAGSMLEHLRRFQNRHVFLPLTSTIQPQMLQQPTGVPIPILPGGEPKYEELPDFPPIVKEMYALVSTDMDDESGLQQVGQAIQSANVQSAKHANVNLQQVQVGLSDLKQNTERALIRGWRILLQLVRAYYTTPMQVSWMSEDGRYKLQSWSAADLGSTHDVRIQRGSFTGLTPQAKAELAQQYKAEGMLSPGDFEHITETNLHGLFGLQDNPHRLRVRRQIAEWQQGPQQPPVMQPPPPVPPPQPGQPPQPPPPPPNPFAGELGKLFSPMPQDTEPQIAALRTYELGRAMASTKFQKWPPAWQQGMTQAYEQARQAAQLPDAKMLTGLQKKLQQMQSKVTEASVKEAKTRVTVSLKGADLDAAQTQAILGAEGVQLPPKQPSAPDQSAQHQVEIERIKTQAELQKQQIQIQGEVQREHIKTVGKLRDADAQRAHAVRMARIKPTGVIPMRPAKPKADTPA